MKQLPFRMRKLNRVLAFCTFLLTFTLAARSQTSTEQFETESHASTSFTDNGVIFNIISRTSTFKVYASAPGTGWNGTAADNRYIDNTGASTFSGPSVSLKTTSNLFKVNRFWTFLSSATLNQNVTGTLTVTGKLSGVTKYTQTKTTGFVTSLGSTNGYTLIDLTNLNGQNYSNIIIDELLITAGGNYQYMALDAFTWVKDTGVLPVTLTSFSASLSKSGILNAEWRTAAETNNSHFILQGSSDGKVWKDLARKDSAIKSAGGAAYQVELNLASVSLAGFSLLGMLLIPFSKRRYGLATLLIVLAVFAFSCAKENKLDTFEPETTGFKSSNPIYLRLAQIDLDGTITYSETLAVKPK